MINNTHSIFLGLGSNMGNREGNIRKAVVLLSEKIYEIKIAKFYESRPSGYLNQANFLNSALSGNTDLSPEKLLAFTQDAQRRLGRLDSVRNGPREIDIDILFYDQISVFMPGLTIPHPRMYDRDFVLKPLLDLDENLVHYGLNVPIKKLLEDIVTEKFIINE